MDSSAEKIEIKLQNTKKSCEDAIHGTLDLYRTGTFTTEDKQTLSKYLITLFNFHLWLGEKIISSQRARVSNVPVRNEVNNTSNFQELPTIVTNSEGTTVYNSDDDTDTFASESIEEQEDFKIKTNNELVAYKFYCSISVLLWEKYKHSQNEEGVTKEYLLSTFGNYFAFESSSWVRVEVIDWLLDDISNEVLIQLIDYGKILLANIKNLRPLPSAVESIPKLAHRCHFGYLYPFHATKTKKYMDWSDDEIIEFFKTLENINETQFRILHCNYQLHLDSLEIDIINIKNETYKKTIGQILIETGIANPIINNLINVGPRMNYCAIMRELKISCDNNNTVRRISYFEPLIKESFLNEEPVVKVKAVGNNFFFVNVEGKEDITEPSIKALMHLLNSIDSIQHYQKLDQAPVVDEIVLALVRNTWYRARVLSVKLQNKHFDKIIVQVFLADYGEIVNVRLFNICAILPEFLQMDFQVIDTMCRIITDIDIYLIESVCSEQKSMPENFYFNAMARNFHPDLIRIHLNILTLYKYINVT
ncbi:hypothetical protein ILUMI_21332 [Ignelater luminosus]|uniref:Tudor domain-containing protein n=1 Tax=Ignelater luminosus TaxID=2038154 RepID=A0A8K0CCD6_IGNLU|nr:hypothetical protein ILUMI_21332 [Ignelater luminosus]